MAEAERMLGRQDVVPSMMAAIQTLGELLHWHLLLASSHTRAGYLWPVYTGG